ncbi:concanavalin A-like lectin/glucanase domain-containing protein [Xylariales sp. PMI_506]|nr:concanavalin A-like lectin/glucanase domain-containing protein [Xylariales sp. PMI_506]
MAKSLRQLVYLSIAALAKARDVYEISFYGADGGPIPFETFPLTRTITPNNSVPISKGAYQDGSNWCGTVQKDLSHGTFTSVSGTWTVPTVSVPSDGTSPDAAYYLYQWVGIDGFYWNSSCDALIQGGTGIILYDGQIDMIFVWTEYYPANPVAVSISVSEGDVFTTNVTVTSSTTGIMYVIGNQGYVKTNQNAYNIASTIENETTGEKGVFDIDGTGLGTICGYTAEWINENANYGVEPYAAFTSIDFSNAIAGTDSGNVVELDTSTILYGTNTDGAVLCNATLESSSNLLVTYYAE